MRKKLEFLAIFLAVWPASRLSYDTGLKVKEPLCLAANIYFEAGNQAYRGKLAVKDVTLSRSKASKTSLCEVVFKRKQFSWTHQQPWKKIVKFLEDRPEVTAAELKAWEASKKAAADPTVVLDERFKHFHAVYVGPDWSVGEKVVIGDHVFIGASK